MKRIATLTVNPTIDLNTSVEQVIPEAKLRCAQPTREPGGGGLNVSRAVRRLGGASRAIYMAGGLTGEILQQLLDAEEIDHHCLPIQNETRENLTVYESTSGNQYRFGMPGPEITENEWSACLSALSELDPAPDYIVASGSLAPGMPEDFYQRVARIAAQSNARFILDSSGRPLRLGAEGGAYLLKPNVRELSDLTGEELSDERQQEQEARKLIEDGLAEVVVISLGAGGARVITAEGSQHLRSPTAPIRSRVGAGDSMVAGIVLGLAKSLDLMDAVRFGLAAGAAAVMTEGTELCRREDTERLYQELTEGES
jgi:6-phosphofructokinase 2